MTSSSARKWRWLFYAYDSLRKTVVAHVFGERTMATLGRLMS
ncbi:IS1 family transposase [Shigella sonnei]